MALDGRGCFFFHIYFFSILRFSGLVFVATISHPERLYALPLKSLIFHPVCKVRFLTRIQNPTHRLRSESIPVATPPAPPLSGLRLLPLLNAWPWLALVARDWVQHDLIRCLGRVGRISLAPIIADGIRKNITGAVESRC
jgi:hypothetical protein